jgi:hypothetical protein
MKSIPNHVDVEAFFLFFCRFAGLIWYAASRHGLDRSCTIDLAENFIQTAKQSSAAENKPKKIDWPDAT